MKTYALLSLLIFVVVSSSAIAQNKADLSFPNPICHGEFKFNPNNTNCEFSPSVPARLDFIGNQINQMLVTSENAFIYRDELLHLAKYPLNSTNQDRIHRDLNYLSQFMTDKKCD